MRITELENSELTYEKKHEFNVGVDLGFLHNRINLAADYYRRNNFDLIGVINTQGAGGTIAKYSFHEIVRYRTDSLHSEYKEERFQLEYRFYFLQDKE